MSKRILVLTGSPRKGGNSDLMAEAFINGAIKAGNVVERFDTGSHIIKPCRACDGCFQNGKACVVDDDFNRLAPLLFTCDVIAFVTPIYWYSFPATIKAAIDKFYSLIVGEKVSTIKEAMLLTCGELDEPVFDGLKKSYELLLADREWIDCGQLIVPNVNKKGDILHTNALLKAEEMGKSLN